MMPLTYAADHLGSDSDTAFTLFASALVNVVCLFACAIVAIFTCRYSGFITSVAEESERADFSVIEY